MTLETLKRIMAKAPKDKACGRDSLNLFVVSHLHDSWLSLYVEAANAVLAGADLGQWNEVEVTMIYKSGDPFLHSSYRPIMIGTVLYKMVSTFVRNHVEVLAEDAGLLSPEQ